MPNGLKQFFGLLLILLNYIKKKIFTLIKKIKIRYIKEFKNLHNDDILDLPIIYTKNKRYKKKLLY